MLDPGLGFDGVRYGVSWLCLWGGTYSYVYVLLRRLWVTGITARFTSLVSFSG